MKLEERKVMKTVIRETSEELLDFYLGKKVLIHGAIFHYSGDVTAMDKDFIKLENTVLVLDSHVDKEGFETSRKFKKGGGVVLVAKQMIEAIFEV